VDTLKALFGAVDGQVIFFTVLALVPNLFLILWAMARLSRDVRILKAKLDMTENDIGLLDQSISSLSAEFQSIRKKDAHANTPSVQITAENTAERSE
jgi:hypothetical protein